METTKYVIRFNRPLDYYGDIIKEDVVFANCETKVAEIIYKSYYLNPEDYKIMHNEPITMFKKDRTSLGLAEKLSELDFEVVDGDTSDDF